MHELGVLCQIVKKVSKIAMQNGIHAVKHITLEVGTESDYVPVFLKKLFPLAVEQIPELQNAELKLEFVPGKRLAIKDIGY